MKKISLLLLCLICLFTLVGCSKTSPKKFTSDAGIEITLNKSFVEKEIVSQNLYLESKTMMFTALKEEKTQFVQLGIDFDSYTLDDYAKLVMRTNKISESILNDTSLVYFEYEKTVSGKDFHYRAYVFKGTDAFWLCQFATEEKNFDGLSKTISTYAKSISVK